jgi:asparagine synthase (glutamine-hydrolysing)
MCGICGVVEPHGTVDADVLRRMNATLVHRGPDDDGLYVDGAAGLGFRRLSIIDLAGGHQPLSNEDGSLWIVFNGEIYNYRSLRAELEGRGHRFRTETDTEVIVHLYEDFGVAALDRLNGMFAFALWDAERRSLFLARDRFGKKPLYYSFSDGRFLFGSEPKALLAHPAFRRLLDIDSVAGYLAFEYVPTPRSIFAGMHKLPAAHWLRLEHGKIAMERWWTLPEPRPDRHSRDDELAEELHTRIRAAVERRLVADVELGAFLSGGIDSSTVVAAMTELLPPHRIKTFSIGFAEGSFDETSHARRVAAAFGTRHFEARFTSRDLLELLPDLFGRVDEPFADASLLPTYLLSRFAREHVTVALGGDGADELLAGYPTFQAERMARILRVPRLANERLLLPLAHLLPVSDANFSADFVLKQFLRGLHEPSAVRHLTWLGSFDARERRSLLRASIADPFAAVLARLATSTTGIDALIALYVQTYLEDDILVKVDRASMAASLEVRAPFLDVELVEFLARVPTQLKLRGMTTKAILKDAMRNRLPAGIADRRKKGFGIPLARWLKGELRELMLDELSHDRLRRQGLFDPAPVEALVREHLDGRRDNRKQLWTLLAFQLWHRHVFAGGRNAA